MAVATTSRTNFGLWALFQILLPMFPILIGLLVQGIAVECKSPLTFLEGVALGLFALGLLASPVSAFVSGAVTSVAKSVRIWTVSVFIGVLVVSVVLVVVYQLSAEIKATSFMVYQFVMVVAALPVSFLSRQ